MKIIILNLIASFLIISCGEDITSNYREIILPPLQIIDFGIENNTSENLTTPVDITSNIQIKFNSKVSRSSLYKGISCTSGKKTAYLYLYTYSYEDGDLVKLIPYYPFIPYIKYTCKVTKDVTNIYNEPIDKEYEFSFKTNNQYYSEKFFNPNNYTYNNVYQFLQRRCIDCHNENNKLNLKKDKTELYNYLTQNKNIKTDKFYVKPNDTENSYLINKLMGIDFYGEKMPINQEIPLNELEKIIGWIKTGALYEEN